jgi:hypothetical protein
LISVSKIADAGFGINFKQGGCEIIQGNQVVMKGTIIGNLYRLELDEKDQNLNLWHTVKKKKPKRGKTSTSDLRND